MTLIQQIAEYLDNQAIGVIAESIFYSYLPDPNEGESFCIAVMDTGGRVPDMDLPTKEPTFQVFLRAQDYATGKAKVDAIRAALHQKRNVELIAGQTYFYFILLQSEGGHLGRSESGHDEFSLNFYCRTR